MAKTYVYYLPQDDELLLVQPNGYNNIKVSTENVDLAFIPVDKSVENPLQLFDELMGDMAVRIGEL